jgi:hypothetical protein
MKQDPINELYPVKATPRPVVRTHKYTEARQEDQPTECGVPADLVKSLHRYVQRCPRMSDPDRGPKTWAKALVLVKALIDKKFDRAVAWDPKFLDKSKQDGEAGYSPADVQEWIDGEAGTYERAKDTVDAVRSALSYCFATPGYSWPPFGSSKPNLLSFLATYCRDSGLYRSPFCLAMRDLTECEQKRKELFSEYPKAVRAVEEIIAGNSWLSSFSESEKATLWRGVGKLLELYSANRSELMEHPGNKVRCSSAEDLIGLVRGWLSSHNGYGLTRSFVRPGLKNWRDFVAWCLSERDVDLRAIGKGAKNG